MSVVMGTVNDTANLDIAAVVEDAFLTESRLSSSIFWSNESPYPLPPFPRLPPPFGKNYPFRLRWPMRQQPIPKIQAIEVLGSGMVPWIPEAPKFPEAPGTSRKIIEDSPMVHSEGGSVR